MHIVVLILMYYSEKVIIYITSIIMCFEFFSPIRKASLRSQAEWLWRSDQAGVQEEGQDNKKDCAENGVHNLQEEEAGTSQEM